ncbi:MAG: hypothetical protein GX963_10470, partial [Bacteroidales bacterium]|nr:hypothetical protein [Bacteroidales bacterium]
MENIPEYFCGYLKINNEYCAYSRNNHRVTLLPAKPAKGTISGLKEHDHPEIKKSQFVMGVDQFGYKVAFMLTAEKKSIFNPFGITSFGAPIIIKSCGNMSDFYDTLTKEWDKFDVISFSGGVINTLYHPKLVALKRKDIKDIVQGYENFDGAATIETLPFDKYTKTIPIIVDKQRADLTISVTQSNGANNLKTYDLGYLISFIRLEFEEPQDFTEISNYYWLVNQFCAILVGQANIDFDVALHQRTSDNKLFKTAICKINDPFENYCSKAFHQVISLSHIWDHLGILIKTIRCSKDNANHILALLPSSNKNLNRIKIDDVQKMCAALEAEYRLGLYKHDKDPQLQKLRETIKTAVKEFQKNNAVLKVNCETTISNLYKNLDYTLADKIHHLYNHHKCDINGLSEKFGLPKITEGRIREFVKLRNSGAHGEMIIWGEAGSIYSLLFALSYLCFFE